MTTLLPELPPVTEPQREAIIDSPRTSAAHRDLLAALPAMNAIQIGGRASGQRLDDTVSVAAWNLERCLFPQDSAGLLAGLAPDVVLLSEVDHGMARTGQRHTTEEVAEALGMAYAFGVEFYEMGLGSPTERAFCTDRANALGWHGNAILARVPFQRLAIVRLDDHGHWFASDELDADATQPRVGGRMVLLAVLETEGGPLCVASTHLESNAGADHRTGQFDLLLDAVDRFAPDVPVLIGGDLNTGNHMPPDYDWRGEALFDQAVARGYDWGFTPEGDTTRPSLITPHPSRKMKLDWICGRGMSCEDTALIPALSPQGRPLSDHDPVWCRAALQKRA